MTLEDQLDELIRGLRRVERAHRAAFRRFERVEATLRAIGTSLVVRRRELGRLRSVFQGIRRREFGRRPRRRVEVVRHREASENIRSARQVVRRALHRQRGHRARRFRRQLQRDIDSAADNRQNIDSAGNQPDDALPDVEVLYDQASAQQTEHREVTDDDLNELLEGIREERAAFERDLERDFVRQFGSGSPDLSSASELD